MEKHQLIISKYHVSYKEYTYKLVFMRTFSCCFSLATLTKHSESGEGHSETLTLAFGENMLKKTFLALLTCLVTFLVCVLELQGNLPFILSANTVGLESLALLLKTGLLLGRWSLTIWAHLDGMLKIALVHSPVRAVLQDLGRLGRDLHRVVIIDNSPASYIFHPDNAVSGFHCACRTGASFAPANFAVSWFGALEASQYTRHEYC